MEQDWSKDKESVFDARAEKFVKKRKSYTVSFKSSDCTEA